MLLRWNPIARALGVAGLLLVFGATLEDASASGRRRRLSRPVYCPPAQYLPFIPNLPPCIPPDNPPDNPPDKPPDKPPQERVRRNINSLSTQQLESLRRGVDAMKKLPNSDPRSWVFQASIHGTSGPMTNPLFGQCKHGSNEFLVWHRGYIYYFERILRELSGDPELTLPYWDWAANKTLPEAFRVPANVSNPLFDGTRFSHINNGLPVPSDVSTDQGIAMARVPFWIGFSSSLESSPHAAVHIDVGGNMTAFATAGLDPVFWMHHCNVDHVWDRWLNQGGGRVNPSEPMFLDTAYSFVDETGATVTRQVRDILSSRKLGYRYDDVPNLAVATAAVAAQVVDPKTHQRVAMSLVAGKPDAPEPKPLGLKAVTEKLPITPKQEGVLRTAVESAHAAPPNKILLKIEGLSASDVPEFSYGVYLNLPEEKLSLEKARLYYVGSFNFFGKARGGKGAHGHGAVGDKTFDETFDATAAVTRLNKAGKWKQEDLRVTLVPLTPETTADAALQKRLEASSAAAKVSYSRVSLFAAP